MAKSKYVEFVFNTKGEPHQISGTDLYYFQEQVGVHKNGYDAFKDHILKKLGSEPTEERHRKLRENAWVIYKKNDNESYEDFVADIKAGNRHKVGDLILTPYNQNLQADKNGNIIVKTLGSDLENYSDVGDVLISKDGKILHNTHGSACINKADDNGYYRLDVFKSEVNKTDGKKDIIRIDVNFLDADGKKIRQEDFFVPTELPNGTVEEKHIRSYYAPNNKKGRKERVGGIYPTGYIMYSENTDRSTPQGLKQYRPRIIAEYYPSASFVVTKYLSGVERSRKTGVPCTPQFPRPIDEYKDEAINRYNSAEFQKLLKLYPEFKKFDETKDLCDIIKRENDSLRTMSIKLKAYHNEPTQ